MKSLHEGLQVEVRIGASLSDSFEVRNGLYQECRLALTLITIYFSAVVARLQYGSAEAGVDVQFHYERKLVGDRTAKLESSMARVTESQFTDDVALCTRSQGGLESVAKKFVNGAGLRI